MAENDRHIDLTAEPTADCPTELTLGQVAEHLGCETEVVYALVRARGVPLRCSPRTGLVLDRAHVDTLRSISR
jgi:hypothetical protein